MRVLALYGLEGTLSRLPGENENYLVRTPSGDRYVLKVAGEECDERTIDMECRAVEHVARAAIGLAVPRTVSTVAGHRFAVLNGGDAGPLRARLLQFVEGEPWDRRAAHPRALLADLGAKLALLDEALAGFAHPAAHRSHRWDLTALHQHRSKLDLIRKRQRRERAKWAFDYWATEAQPALPRLPRSFIHGDANDENILTRGDRVVGLLDFGDSLDNPIVCELAVALAYVMLDAPSPLAAGAEVVAAYHRIRPLDVCELRVLFALICGRLVNTLVVAAERRRLDPARESWFVTEERAWRLLDKLIETQPIAANRALAAGTGLDL